MTEGMLEVNRILVAFIVFALVLIRCGSVVVFAPFFGSELFSTHFRLMLACCFSLIMVPAAAETAAIPRSLDVLALALLAGQELSIGLTIGFMSSLVFIGAQLAGELAGQQIGFSMANVIDPMTDIEVPLLGFMNMNFAMALFITANLHLVLLYVMFKSYDFVGIGAMLPDVAIPPAVEMSMWQAREVLLLGLQLAIPVMLIMLLNSVAEGFITKTMPQMNIMVLGMPLRVVLGVSSLIFIYPAICWALVPGDWRFNLMTMPEGAFGDMLTDLHGMVREMGNAGVRNY